MMVVLNCVIPLLVVLFMLWLVNLLLGTNLRLPSDAFHMGSRVRQKAVREIKNKKAASNAAGSQESSSKNHVI